MRKGVRFRFQTAGLCLPIVVLFATVGCRSVETRFEITAFGSSDSPEVFTENRFGPGAFSKDTRNDYHIAFEVPAEWVPFDAVGPDRPTSRSVGDSPSDEAGGPAGVFMSQIILIRFIWRPRPGTTYAESTQTNATISYCLVRGDNAISYEGAGFVYFKLSRDGRTMTGRIESATLAPSRFAREPMDLFGPCRLKGTFTASRDKRRIVSAQQTIRRLFGPRLPARAMHRPPEADRAFANTR